MKKATLHYEAAAMAGHEMARLNLGYKEALFKHGTSYKTLEYCSICWMLSCNA
jgi:hypothetical protein